EPREQRLLRNIQRATGQEIAIEALPTVADLRARRIELFKASLVEAMQAGELEPYQNMLAELGEEHPPGDLAAAALKMAHEALHPKSQEAEIPGGKPGRPEREDRWAERNAGEREAGPRERFEERRPARSSGPSAHGFDVARLFIGAGRIDNLRPGDLVGAIANEAGLPGDAIGAIRITERFSLVEVPEEFAEDVIAALSGTKIRGRRVQVRRDRLG
ncbi:MAG: DbpA RNA binding domain-containing protein, partial [Planctomycetia bacterium]